MQRCLFVGGPWDGRIEEVRDPHRPLMVPAKTEMAPLTLRVPEPAEKIARRLFDVRYSPQVFSDGRSDFVLMVSEGAAVPSYAEARRLWREAENPTPAPPEMPPLGHPWANAAADALREFDKRQRASQPDFVGLLKALLVEERGHSAEDAERLVKSHPGIVVQGIMSGTFGLRAAAMALEMADSGAASE